MCRLQNHPDIGTKLTFSKVEPKGNNFPFYFVYSSSLSVNEVVNKVYNLANKDSLKDAAILSRGIIQRGFF